MSYRPERVLSDSLRLLLLRSCCLLCVCAGMPLGGMPPPSVDRLRRPFRGDEQRAYGVRVNEFHNLADAAPYVAPAVALKLQTLWDSGVRLVSLLDDRSGWPDWS